jgi:hypothetical protein
VRHETIDLRYETKSKKSLPGSIITLLSHVSHLISHIYFKTLSHVSRLTTHIYYPMNWRHYIHVIKKTLQRNGFHKLADEVLMAEVNAGKNANATLKEVVSKLAQFKRNEQEAYGYIVTEAEALIRFAKTYGIEPSD